MKNRKLVLVIMPWVLLATTYFVFIWLEKFLGPKVGYFLAFTFYWGFWCLVFPLWFSGKKEIKEMFKQVKLPCGKQNIINKVLLILPPLFALTVFFTKLPRVTLLIILASLALALINATAEEILWRGVYIREFSGSLFMGYLYPTFGFAIWHLAPQAVHPINMPGGVTAFIMGALFMGGCWGWAAWKTDSITWSTLSHILTDFLGLGSTIYFLY